MIKDDERKLMAALQSAPRLQPRAAADLIGIHENRAAAILEKWTRRGWYDYGVSVMAGWLTDEGRAARFE
jgi:DNA-binding Lrp family transcriptional regulator